MLHKPCDSNSSCTKAEQTDFNPSQSLIRFILIIPNGNAWRQKSQSTCVLNATQLPKEHYSVEGLQFSPFYARLRNCEKRLLALSCLSVCPHATPRLPLVGFSWHLIFEHLSQCCRENIQVSLTSDKKNVYCKWRHMYIMIHSRWMVLTWEVFQTKVWKKMKTFILFWITFFFRKRHRLCENMEKYGTVGEAMDDKKLWSMRIACWITKTTNTHPHRMCNTYCVSVAPVV